MQALLPRHSLAAAVSLRPLPSPLRSLPFAQSSQAVKAHRAQPAHLEWRRRAEPEAAPEPSSTSSTAPQPDPEPEVTFYEGSGSNAELALSLLLGATLIFLPLTLASIGRRLWIQYRFTNKRLILTTNSPVLKREVQVEYKKIKEIRSAPRAFGLWGDIVIFLKDGSRLPLAGLERYQEIVDYVQGHMD